MGGERQDAGPAILEAIANRWSPRAWSDRRVEPDKIATCLEAARWAASSMNQQPWHFVVATIEQRDCHSRFVACLSEANVRWASRAPVLMFSVAKRAFDNEQPNRFAWHDTGLATAGLMIQATALGLHVHCMGGFSRATARQHLGIRDDFDPVAAIAMGYVGSPDSLPDGLRETELVVRSRRPTAQWVFGERWGNPWPCDRLKSR